MDIVVLFEGAEHRVRLTAATQARQLHKAICATCDVPPSSTLVLTDQHGASTPPPVAAAADR